MHAGVTRHPAYRNDASLGAGVQDVAVLVHGNLHDRGGPPEDGPCQGG